MNNKNRSKVDESPEKKKAVTIIKRNGKREDREMTLDEIRQLPQGVKIEYKNDVVFGDIQNKKQGSPVVDRAFSFEYTR